MGWLALGVLLLLAYLAATGRLTKVWSDIVG
jgi:hypothetical protein